MAANSSQPAEAFRGLLLRHRGRTGLTQGQLADRLGIHRRSIQDWEAGVNHPSAERLQGLIAALLHAGGMSTGHEAEEAHALWAAVERDSLRMRTPFDSVWFARLLESRATPSPLPGSAVAVERRQDWGEAPDMHGFVGRAKELEMLRRWVLDERCRVVALVGIGGIGKTSLAARLAQEVAPSFERVFWRSLRDAPPTSDWLAGAIGFLSDQTVVPPPRESERITALLQLLRDRRCLLVLDNFETVYEPGQREGRYREGVQGYGRVLQAVSDATPQSCLVLTSRETPPELAVLGDGGVRSVPLAGLGVDEAQVLLASRQLVGSSEQWAALIARVGAMAWP